MTTFKLLFSYAFRPLFLCTVASAIVLIGWWLAFWSGISPAPASTISPLAWHGHEMLFGVVGSAIGGFLLTAVANWTGRPAVSGARLIALVVAWLAARIVFVLSPDIGPLAMLLIDVSYWILLAVIMCNEVIAGRNFRNLKIVGILIVFLSLNAAFHFDSVFDTQFGTQALSINAAIMLVCILISVIGGRIIPAFTGNWLRRQFGMDTPVPAAFSWFDGLVVTMSAIGGVAWVILPYSTIAGSLLILAGCFQLLRVARWQGHRTFVEPLVLILHVSYSWLGAGLVLIGVSQVWNGLPVSAGLHALGVGAMAGLIIAVSSRAAMGHTNRELASDRMLSSVFVLINLAALARVIASELPEVVYIAGLLWIAAFVVYGIRIAPILVRPALKSGL